ncbi:HAD-IIA family hydrolase [Streptomyces sp. HNM0645]|uniref:HAD-IIA family hydrolase n=1 Tax=Streptomyces sp. HNM0645 TaxID=2782343 RepID=UPI0024B6634C|nr:HAD-IIA family hydrolase [Streptomyces sp. HNM0645]MDI9885574.1 HAD-IIA family hydrolase [Streptomyces sp. HNM0645]
MTVPLLPASPDRPLLAGCRRAPVEEYDTALLDLDGVVYAGPEAVPHAVDALHRADRAGMRLAYVTNNASRTPEDVAGHLTRLGVPTGPDAVVTSAQAAARLVAEQVPAGAAVLVVGGKGLHEALREHGLRPVGSLADEPVAVVQGFDPGVGWPELAEASYAVVAGLPWIASNTDLSLPTDRGRAPGNGALVGAVRAATGAEPQVAGKPMPVMHRESMLRTAARRPLVVGDRLDTDIAGAVNGGVDSLLVLTGVTTAGQLLAAGPQERPTHVAADLRGLLTPHPAVTPGPGHAFHCGGWLARTADGRLLLEGEGPDPVDALRALCAAAWTAGDRIGTTPVLDPAGPAGTVLGALHATP